MSVNVSAIFNQVVMKGDYFSLYYKPIKNFNDDICGLDVIIKLNPNICKILDGRDHVRNLSDFNGLCEKYELAKEHMSNVLNKIRYDLPYLRVLKSIEIINFSAGMELLDEDINLELQSLIEYSSVCRLKLGCEVRKAVTVDNDLFFKRIYDLGMECLIVNSEITINEIFKFVSLGFLTFGSGYVKINYPKIINDDECNDDIRHLSMIAKRMGKKVILSNIENNKCLSFAKKIEVDFVQGFYIGRALTAFDLYSKYTPENISLKDICN